MDKKGFTAYLEGKDFAPKTQKGCLSYIKLFFDWLGKEDIQVTKPDVLRYLEHLKNKGLQNVTRQRQLKAINHYFTFLYQDGQITDNPCLFLKIVGTNKKTLHKIYTPEELDGLFDAYYLLYVRNYDDSRQRHDLSRHYSALSRERNALILSILLYQGTTTTEIDRIETGDIDLIKATIKIRSRKRLNERVLPLKAAQIGLLMQYLQNIRPQILQYHTTESNKLFLPLPVISKKIIDNELMYIYELLATQIRRIDRQFLNFTQIRASVVTFWIKTHGLRKAQYMAGYKNIRTTETYLPNNLEDLTNDISKLHPF